MISGVLASSSAFLQTFPTQNFSKPKTSSFCSASLSSVGVQKLCSADLQLQIVGFYGSKGSRISRVNCNSGSGPVGPGFGDGDSKSVLDAFFLGKALAEAINERIESSVGEFLSTIGRLQAEQQKQVEEFQVDVLERAKRAKEKAAREAGEATGRVKPTAEDIPPVTITNGVTPVTSTTYVAPPPSLSEAAPSTTKNALDPFDKDTVIGEPTDD